MIKIRDHLKHYLIIKDLVTNFQQAQYRYLDVIYFNSRKSFDSFQSFLRSFLLPVDVFKILFYFFKHNKYSCLIILMYEVFEGLFHLTVVSSSSCSGFLFICAPWAAHYTWKIIRRYSFRVRTKSK